MNRFAIVFLFALTVCTYLTGQKAVHAPNDLYSDAVEFIFSGDYSEALPSLITLSERGFASPNISYLIGECYLNIQGQKTKAIPYLKEAVQKISKTYTGKSLQEEYAPNKALLYLGIAYRLNNDFDGALLFFDKYMHSLDDVEQESIRLTEYHIERCRNARELMENPAKFTSDTLPDEINTAYSNFNPLVTPDEKVLYYMNKLKFYDAIMHAVKVDKFWMSPENLTPSVKSDGDHYITGISADGTKLLLTSYDPYLSGEIYATEYKNGTWSELQKLNDNINTRFNETHASFSPDGQVLYFTSDRIGGFGGLDIYKSVKNGTGDWDKPKNLGPLVNSPYNEESPFVSPDGNKLFFSSQGHYNMGGYDVFCSTPDNENSWLPPVNIGYPLNTTDDDVFFFPLDSGRVAYQARFSTSTAQLDIVRYLIDSFAKPVRFAINGKIEFEADSAFDPSGILVAFIDRSADDTLFVKPLNSDGSFRLKLPGGSYKLNFSDGTKSLLSRNLDIPDYFPHTNLVFNEKIVVPVTSVISDTLRVKDIRFAFDKSNFSTEYQLYLEDLAKALQKYPGITIQVNGYADDIGSEDYNLKLSFTRANQVADYLKSKIILPERISLKAYGERNPIALNKRDDGSDNPLGRTFNRRVGIVIVNAPHALVVIGIHDVPGELLQR